VVRDERRSIYDGGYMWVWMSTMGCVVAMSDSEWGCGEGARLALAGMEQGVRREDSHSAAYQLKNLTQMRL
jgi:hypothetical protein